MTVPSWRVSPSDFFVGGLCTCVIALCSSIAALLLWYLRRLSAAKATAKPRESDTESTPLIAEECQESSPRLNVAFLMLIGFAPLATCLLVGGLFDNVVAAMFAMHWSCMLLLPLLFYVLRAKMSADSQYLARTSSFYRALSKEEQTNALRRLMRGSALGIPICMGLVFGYAMFRCKIFDWPLCIHDIRKPMEANGFEGHSMMFRSVAAAYFTIWNPAIEEFFWRVFLHRELSSESAAIARPQGHQLDQRPQQAANSNNAKVEDLRCPTR